MTWKFACLSVDPTPLAWDGVPVCGIPSRPFRGPGYRRSSRIDLLRILTYPGRMATHPVNDTLRHIKFALPPSLYGIRYADALIPEFLVLRCACRPAQIGGYDL
jgi:hypothetical protein